jgi:hypothetical protein
MSMSSCQMAGMTFAEQIHVGSDRIADSSLAYCRGMSLCGSSP